MLHVFFSGKKSHLLKCEHRIHWTTDPIASDLVEAIRIYSCTLILLISISSHEIRYHFIFHFCAYFFTLTCTVSGTVFGQTANTGHEASQHNLKVGWDLSLTTWAFSLIIYAKQYEAAVKSCFCSNLLWLNVLISGQRWSLDLPSKHINTDGPVLL